MGDRLTAEDRALIEQAVAEGRVNRVERRKKVERRETVEIPTAEPREASRKLPPVRKQLPAEMSVRAALEWAFGTELASMDADEVGASSGGQRRGVGMEYILQQRFMLGGVSIDTSRGSSSAADDAEVIASVVRATLFWADACWVAELARAGRVPDAMVGVVPRLGPLNWTHGRGGYIGRKEDSSELGEQGWRPVTRRNRKGYLVSEVVPYTPCTWHPEPHQIGAARRRYLDWWGHLLSVQVAIRAAGLKQFSITDEMPPMTPWRN